MKTQTEAIIRCRAFSGEGVRENRIIIEGDEIRVWDRIAGHFTRCHIISQASQKRIAKKLCTASK